MFILNRQALALVTSFFPLLCRLIFFHEKHEEGLKTFGFVWDLFRENDSESMHKALLWLQVCFKSY